jgi:hypothetical protein
MDQTNTPVPPPRRPGSPGIHRLGVALATIAAVATFSGAAAVSGGIAPTGAATDTTVTAAPDAGALPRTLVQTVYVPAPQPAATEPPVKVIVINKPSRGDDGEEGAEGGDD